MNLSLSLKRNWTSRDLTSFGLVWPMEVAFFVVVVVVVVAVDDLF